jgi:deoxyribose-phosphate aldolase
MMSTLRELMAPIEDYLGRLPDTSALAEKVRASDLEQLARSTATDQPLPAAEEIAKLIDHTLLKPEAAPAEIDRLCREARQAAFARVCVNSSHVPRAAQVLAGSAVEVCAVVGFPLGAASTLAKAAEAAAAIEAGAREIDMVLPVGALRAAEYDVVAQDIAAVAAVTHAGGALLKVIFENSLLSPPQQAAACLLAVGAGAEFVKTSTGFGASGAVEDDVRRMRAIVGARIGVKAAGGIRSRADLERMVRAGANRIGTSSGVKIMREYGLGKA